MTPAEAIQQSALAVWVKQAPGVFPTIEALHIIGFAVLVGSVVVYDLRALGLGRAISAQALAKLALPISLASLLVVLPTGFLMFIGAASDLIANRAFVWKMGLLLVAGTNAGLYHMLYREANGEPWRLAKVQAGASILLWCAIITCGRWIAYV
jgi:hypothetical protein